MWITQAGLGTRNTGTCDRYSPREMFTLYYTQHTCNTTGTFTTVTTYNRQYCSHLNRPSHLGLYHYRGVLSYMEDPEDHGGTGRNNVRKLVDREEAGVSSYLPARATDAPMFGMALPVPGSDYHHLLLQQVVTPPPPTA